MKKVLVNFLCVLGLAQSIYADTLGHARHAIPSSYGFNKAVAGIVGTSEVKVNDLVNTYALTVSQWLLLQFFYQGIYLKPDYKAHLSAFLHVEQLIYLGGITYSYIDEAVRTSNSAQLAAFGLNAITGVLFIKWWHRRYY